MKRYPHISILVVVFGFLFPFVGQAHLVKFSDSDLFLRGEGLEWTLQVHQNDYEQLFKGADSDSVHQYLETHLNVRRGEKECSLRHFKIETVSERELVRLILNYHCPTFSSKLEVSYGLFFGDLTHRHLLKLHTGDSELSKIFSNQDSEATFLAPSFTQIIFDFLKLGLDHILLGWDHLLFIFTLLLGIRRFKNLLAVITAFTVAHSISLALAVLGIVSLSSAVVEPLIAASILFLAIRDLRWGENQSVWSNALLVFFFGLIHGLGFSTLLREMNIQHSQIILPLAFFNVGVELGQILVVASLFPLLQLFRRKAENAYLKTKTILLVLISAMAIYWIVQRVFLKS